jgi:hypothetical protein
VKVESQPEIIEHKSEQQPKLEDQREPLPEAATSIIK